MSIDLMIDLVRQDRIGDVAERVPTALTDLLGFSVVEPVGVMELEEGVRFAADLTQPIDSNTAWTLHLPGYLEFAIVGRTEVHDESQPPAAVCLSR